MAATGFLSANHQFFDNNGDPLVGGLVYFYTAGTSTPQDTFSNADLDPVHANTNPIVLNAAGRAVIYYSPTPAYKVIVKTSGGVLVTSQDEDSPAAVAS